MCMYCMYAYNDVLKSLFMKICATHTYSERVQVVNAHENLFHMLGSVLLRV